MSVPRVALGEVASIVSGFAFKSELFNTEGDGLPLVRIRDVTAGTSETFYSGSYREEFAVADGDALVGMDGEFNLGIWRGGRALLNQRVCKIKASDNRLSQEYLVRFLPRALKAIEGRTPFVTVKHLSVKELRDIEVPLPALVEQRRIAAILDKADALRAKRRQAIAKLDQLLRSVFLDMFGDPVTNQKGWPEMPLGELVESTKIGLVRSANDFGDDFDVPYVRMDAVSADGKFLPEKVKNTNVTEREMRDYALEPGDFLFNTRNSRDLVGKTCVYPGPTGWTFNNNLMRIRFREGVESSVIAMQFQFGRVKEELAKRKSGTTSVYAVYWRELQSLPLMLPAAAQQRAFAAVAKKIEARSLMLGAHSAHLNTLFASLQHRAFSGTL